MWVAWQAGRWWYGVNNRVNNGNVGDMNSGNLGMPGRETIVNNFFGLVLRRNHSEMMPAKGQI